MAAMCGWVGLISARYSVQLCEAILRNMCQNNVKNNNRPKSEKVSNPKEWETSSEPGGTQNEPSTAAEVENYSLTVHNDSRTTTNDQKQQVTRKREYCLQEMDYLLCRRVNNPAGAKGTQKCVVCRKKKQKVKIRN